MARYKEIKRIDSSMVRSLCIKEKYYTCGDNAAYMNLLTTLCGSEKEMTMDDLEEIADDILMHSDGEIFSERYGSPEEVFEAVLWQLINECCIVSVERI